jgi:CheY-like chemotaxis protein
LETDLSAEQRKYSSEIHNSSQALLILVNDILDFCKIESGKVEVESICFNVRETVHEIVRLMESLAQDKDLVISFSVQPEIGEFFEGDPYRLRQILINLVNNALKFTEQGRVDIVCALVGEDDAKQLVRFDVMDTGIGISRADQRKLFKSFSQVDASTTRKYGGTGLGLAISADLVALLGGEIDVASELGIGSKFGFVIPLQRSQGSQADTGMGEAGDGQQQRLGGKILVAEDNPVNQLLISKILKKWACDVQLVSNGQEAFEAIQQHQYDVVLMDCQMPVLDGYEATRAIREWERDRNTQIPIIALTANAMAGDQERCLAAGMTDFTTKPIVQDDLYCLLSTVLPSVSS